MENIINVDSNSVAKHSLLDAFYDRYSDLIDFNGLNSFSLHYKGDSLIRFGISSKASEPVIENTENEPLEESEIKITNNNNNIVNSRRKPLFASISAVLSSKNISCVGDSQELGNICKNLLELDLSNNRFSDWNEIRNLLASLKKLRFLNLTANFFYDPATDSESKANNTQELQSVVEYFDREWSLSTLNLSNLNTLILKECYIDLRIIECVLERLNGLNELHLSRNNYKRINFSKNFTHPSLKVLYFNTNKLEDWHEVCKLGKSFQNLEHLALSENDLRNFTIDVKDHEINQEHFNDIEELTNSKLFKNLVSLNINRLKINDWSTVDQFGDFPKLKNIRIHNIPLLDHLTTEEEKHSILVGHLHESINCLNGSNITKEFKESCERAYLRHFQDQEKKPNRYYELEAKHGKLEKLADVSFNICTTAQCKIKFNEKQVYEKVNIRQTVGQFKKQLETFVGAPSSRFRLFYVDMEVNNAFGHDELKLPNVSLITLNLKDGDEFDIILKSVSSIKKK